MLRDPLCFLPLGSADQTLVKVHASPAWRAARRRRVTSRGPCQCATQRARSRLQHPCRVSVKYRHNRPLIETARVAADALGAPRAAEPTTTKRTRGERRMTTSTAIPARLLQALKAINASAPRLISSPTFSPGQAHHGASRRASVAISERTVSPDGRSAERSHGEQSSVSDLRSPCRRRQDLRRQRPQRRQQQHRAPRVIARKRTCRLLSSRSLPSAGCRQACQSSSSSSERHARATDGARTSPSPADGPSRTTRTASTRPCARRGRVRLCDLDTRARSS